MGSAPVDEVTLKTSFAAKTGVSKITAALTKNLIADPPSSLYNTIKIDNDQTVSPACQIVRQPFLIDAHTNYLQ